MSAPTFERQVGKSASLKMAEALERRVGSAFPNDYMVKNVDIEQLSSLFEDSRDMNVLG